MIGTSNMLDCWNYPELACFLAKFGVELEQSNILHLKIKLSSASHYPKWHLLNAVQTVQHVTKITKSQS